MTQLQYWIDKSHSSTRNMLSYLEKVSVSEENLEESHRHVFTSGNKRDCWQHYTNSAFLPAALPKQINSNFGLMLSHQPP